MRQIVGRPCWPLFLEIGGEDRRLTILSLAVLLHAVGRHGSRQRYLKRMPKSNQVLRIQRNHVRDGQKQRDGEKSAETT